MGILDSRRAQDKVVQGSNSTDLPRPLGDYTLLARLAVGGMAEVYVAKARGIGGFEKLTAIKVIHPRFSEDEHFIRMLVEEAKISVLLTHVNVVQTFDLGRIDDTHFIVMEYIEGADAFQILKRAHQRGVELPLDVCAFVVSEVCNGLDYAHRKRDAQGQPLEIVHRDVSPHNVLVSYTGEVKLVDFGIAKAALRTVQTEAGVIKGKYYYMSPEQAWGDQMDRRTDVFSAGVVLYELLTGEMLYQGSNVPALLEQVRKASIDPPTARRSDVPEELSNIVMRALARLPEDRFQSAHDMGQALTQFLYSSSPSFTSQRISDLMGSLFEKEKAELSKVGPDVEETRPKSSEPGFLGRMSRDEFAFDDTSSIIFDLNRGVRSSPQSVASRETAETDLPEEAPRRRKPSPAPAAAAEDADAVPAPSGDDVWDDKTLADAGGGVWDDQTRVDYQSRAVAQAMASTLVADEQAKPVSPARVTRVTQKSSAPASSSAGSSNRIPPQPSPEEGADATELVSAPPGSVPPPPPPKVPLAPVRAKSGGRPVSRSAKPGAARPAHIGPLDPPPSGSLPKPQVTEAGSAGPASASPPVPTPASAPSPPFAFPAPPAVAAPRDPQPPQWPLPTPLPPAQTPRSQPEPAETGVSEDPTARVSSPPVVPEGWPPPPALGLTNQLLVPRKRIPWKWVVAAATALSVLVALGALGLYVLAPADPGSLLTVVSYPGGAKVSLDGVEYPGVTPLTIDEGLDLEGTHRLEVSLDGFEPWTSTFRPTAGLVQQIAVLRPIRTTLRIESDPIGAEIFVNGAPHGRSPLEVENLPVGRPIVVRAVQEGRGEVEQQVTIAVDDTAPVVILKLPDE